MGEDTPPPAPPGVRLRIIGDRWVDVTNRQGVGNAGDDIIVLWPAQRMSRAEALVHACWLIQAAESAVGEFDEVRHKVRGA